MTKLARILIAATALLHVYIAWFEIFAWTSVGPDTFDSIDPAIFPETVDMAANQGVYNAFLAIGLFWSLFIKDDTWATRIATCFLAFVGLAGVTAALTLGLSTGVPQLLTAALGLSALARGGAFRVRPDQSEGA